MTLVFYPKQITPAHLFSTSVINPKTPSEEVKSFKSVSDEYLRVCEEICDLVGDGVKSVPFKPAILNRIQFLQNRRLVYDELDLRFLH